MLSYFRCKIIIIKITSSATILPSALRVLVNLDMELTLTIAAFSVSPDIFYSFILQVQYNLNGSNTDGSFTLDDSNSFQSLQNPSNSSRKQIFWDFFPYFIMELYVVCIHKNRLIEAILMSTLNIQSLCRQLKKFPKLSLFASWTGAMINPQWLELPMSRTNFHGPKDVRAIDVRLYYTFEGV